MEEPMEAADVPQDGGDPPIPAPIEPINPQLDKYNDDWKAVQAAPHDFTAWTTLITSAEKLDDLDRLKAVYEPFLASFPLCYGYWKKYADVEARKQNIATAMHIFERGTAATPYSMDLWGHYAAFNKANGGSPDDVRIIYERAVAYCGSDYVAHTLWDKYVAFEEEVGTTSAVAALYTRILSLPLRELPRYLSSLQSLAAARSAADLMPADEFEALMAGLTAQKEAEAAAARAGAATDQDVGVEGAVTVSDEEIKAVWLSQREVTYAAGCAAAAARKDFEEGIRRPYFHVKPLDSAQLLNWARYLDYVEAQGPEYLSSTIVVYERCLVACASYPEFWERYIQWLEGQARTEEADNALQRTVGVFCKLRPEMHLFAARYEERHGRIGDARERYVHVLDVLAPRLLQAVIAYANFERRQGNTGAGCSRYETLLKGEREKEDGRGSKLYPFIAMQYANFLLKVCGDADKARATLAEALDVVPHIRQVWEAAIHLEEAVGGPGASERVLTLYERAVAPTTGDGPKRLSEKDREEMSTRRVEYTDMHGDAQALNRAQRDHSAHFNLPTSIAASAAAAAAAQDSSRKRMHEVAAALPNGEDAAAKAAKVDSTAAAAAAAYAHYPAAAAVAPDPAAYGHYQQAAYGHYPAAGAWGYGAGAGGYGYGY